MTRKGCENGFALTKVERRIGGAHTLAACGGFRLRMGGTAVLSGRWGKSWKTGCMGLEMK